MNTMPPKVTIIVNGRFHAFDYAAELQKRGMLHKLISSMPESRAIRYGIDRDKYVGFPVFEAMKVVWRKLFRGELPTMLYAKLFTSTALRAVPDDTDVIISFAGYSLEIFKSEKVGNALIVLDRSSTHTLSNVELNKNAASYHHVAHSRHSDAFLNRELEEYNLADIILVPTSFVKQTFLDQGVAEDKLLQIPYAMSSRKFDISAEATYPKSKAVLFVGQLSPRKGIKVLIDAMVQVRTTYPDYELWLVGALNSRIDKRILDKDWIKVRGILSGKDLFEAYARASVFCLPSYEEGLAYVLTESNHFKLPIVATQNSGAEDAITEKERLFLCLPGDPDDLARQLSLAISYSVAKCLDHSVYERSGAHSMSWPQYCDALVERIAYAHPMAGS